MFEKSDDFRQIIAEILNKKYFYLKHMKYIFTRVIFRYFILIICYISCDFFIIEF